MRQIKNNQSGFTLIELVVVIVILGILAVTALPKFVDLSDQASEAAVEGVAGAVSSASSVNYAASKVAGAAFEAVDDCADAGSLLQGDTLPTGYTASGGAVAANTTVGCTITDADGNTATANLTGT